MSLVEPYAAKIFIWACTKRHRYGLYAVEVFQYVCGGNLEEKWQHTYYTVRNPFRQSMARFYYIYCVSFTKYT